MEIGAYEARTRFAALLKRVEEGERITIMRHGRPVAVLMPPPGVPDRTVSEAIDAIRAMRAGRKLGDGVTVRDLLEEGRR
jgi:prevent-host-death family protein